MDVAALPYERGMHGCFTADAFVICARCEMRRGNSARARYSVATIAEAVFRGVIIYAVDCCCCTVDFSVFARLSLSLRLSFSGGIYAGGHQSVIIN